MTHWATLFMFVWIAEYKATHANYEKALFFGYGWLTLYILCFITYLIRRRYHH